MDANEPIGVDRHETVHAWRRARPRRAARWRRARRRTTIATLC